MAIVEVVESAPGTRRLKVSNPATREPIGEMPITSPAEVRAAVDRARAAQPGWAARSFRERGRVLDLVLSLVLRRKEELIDVIVRETGRPRLETVFMEIFPACDSLSYYA